MAEISPGRKPLRSRRGCYTCRAKKVKCDEQRSTCGRCRRLQLDCDWQGQLKATVIKNSSKSLLPKRPINEEIESVKFTEASAISPSSSFWELVDASQSQELGLAPWTPSPDSSLSQRIVLHTGFQVTSRECHAVQHFQTRFSLSRSCKSPPWSTHSLMLYLGIGAPMVMHLIIASSLADLVVQSKDIALADLAAKHYRVGVFLLKESIEEERCEHSNVLTCFFLLYVFLSMQEDNPTSLPRLSHTTLEYVNRYNLDGQCSSAVASLVPDDQRTFVARMLIWILYEDIAISFLGHGGKLAQYSRLRPAALEAVYEQSSSTFETCWGSFYPDSEAVDDVENSAVLRFLFDVMCLMEDITQAETSGEALTIGRNLDQLQEKSRSIFRLTNVKDNLTSRLLINADWAAALFYSLRIYLFRRMDGITPTEKVQTALSSLLLIAQRRLSTGRTEMFRRLEMPLFMAAIETTDPIHREWVTSKLTVPRYKQAAAAILKLQHEWGVRANWMTIQDLLRGDCSIPSSNAPDFALE